MSFSASSPLSFSSPVENLTAGFLSDLWELRDRRVDGMPLMSSPWPVVGLCLGYLVLVLWALPWYMRDRRPFDLKGTMVAYNLFQVIFSAVMVAGGLKAGWAGDYSFTCQPVDYSDDPKAVLMVKVVWLYFFSKFVEFLDTIFFVLRKKQNQVTFLHVSHHLLMALYMWPSMRFLPGGHVSLGGVLNAFVHVVMYSYYLAAAAGGRAHRWARRWKRGLTCLQLAQFFIILFHNAQLLVGKGRDCDFPKSHAVVTIAMMLFFVVLFGNFYVKEYLERRRSAPATTEIHSNGSAVKLKKED